MAALQLSPPGRKGGFWLLRAATFCLRAERKARAHSLLSQLFGRRRPARNNEPQTLIYLKFEIFFPGVSVLTGVAETNQRGQADGRGAGTQRSSERVLGLREKPPDLKQESGLAGERALVLQERRVEEDGRERKDWMKKKHEEANDEKWLAATEQGLRDYFESGRPAAPLRP